MIITTLKPLIAVAIAAIALAGCISPEERYERDTAQCNAYGFSQAPPVGHTEADGSSSGTDTAGNDAFANCMMTLDQNRRAAARAALEESADQLQQQGREMELQSQIQMLGAAAMAPRP